MKKMFKIILLVCLISNSLCAQYQINAGEDQNVCFGELAQIDAEIVMMPQNGEVSCILWEPSTGLDDPTILNPICSPIETITYTITISDALGNSAQDEIIISVSNFEETLITPSSGVLCLGNDNLILTAAENDPDYDFLWSTGETTQEIEVDQPGDYAVTVTDGGNCSAEDMVSIIDGNDPYAIKTMFEENGFYSIDIEILGPVMISNLTETNLTSDYAEMLIEIEDEEFNVVDKIESFFQNEVVFDGVDEDILQSYISDNSNLCTFPGLYEQIMDDLNQQFSGFYLHLWDSPVDGESDIMFIRGKSFVEAGVLTPISEEHEDYISRIFTSIDGTPLPSDFSSEDDRTIFTLLDLHLYNAIDGDLFSSDEGNENALSMPPDECDWTQESTILLSPSGSPYRIEEAALLRFGANESVKDFIDPQALVGYTTTEGIFSGRYIALPPNDDDFTFVGYRKEGHKGYISSDPPVILPGTQIEIELGLPYLNQIGDVILACPTFLIAKTEFTPNYVDEKGAGPFLSDFEYAGDYGEYFGTTRIVLNCLPEISYENWTKSIAVEIQGQNDYIFKTYDANNIVQRIRAYTVGTDPEIFYEIFNCANGTWEVWDVPEYPEHISFLFVFLGALYDAGHIALEAGGMIPVVGEVFDVANAVWYYAEGNEEKAIIAIGSVIIFSDVLKIGDKLRLFKRGRKVGKVVRQYKNLDGGDELKALQIEKILDEIVDVYEGNLALAKPRAKELMEWLLKPENVHIFDKFEANIKLVRAWDVLREIGSDLHIDVPALTKLVDDIEINPALEAFLRNNPSKKDAWELIHMSFYSHDIDVLNYVDELKSVAKVGSSSTTGYAQTFFNAFPNQSLQGNGFTVHHAIEKDILNPTNRFYGIFTQSEIHSLQNLRGVSPEINGPLHLSNIRLEWNDFYNQFPEGGPLPTKQQFLDKATEIDNLFGGLFIPPVRSL